MTRIIILEGADGAGKSTLGRYLSEQMGVTVQHFDRRRSVSKTVARTYVEAMLPALMGYRHVVMDRSWYSEKPYADAFWGGDDRLGRARVRMLERIAMIARTVVIKCDPGWDAVMASYTARRETELLDSADQLRQVYDAYKDVSPSLPTMMFNYNNHEPMDVVSNMVAATRQHSGVSFYSAGNLEAKTLVVVNRLETKQVADADSYWQFPGVSFSGAGDLLWLTNQFEQAGIGEERLLWTYPDSVARLIDNGCRPQMVLAIGVQAQSACREAGIANVVELPSPTAWKAKVSTTAPFPLEAV